MKMAFCAACGNEVLDTAVVCVKCGSAISGKPAVVSGDKWSQGTMIGLIIGTMIIPFIGIVAGIVGLCKEPKRIQGGILLGAGVFMMLVWCLIQK
jgi:hypothetical protein